MLYYGLGRSLADIPVIKAGGGAHVQPTTDNGPTFYVEPRGPSGYTSFGAQTLFYNYLVKLGTRTQATIAAIQQTGQITTPYPWDQMAGCYYQRHYLANTPILDPPGVINLLGVTFTVDELKAGKLERVFAPNTEQRFLIDYAIYAKSQDMVAGAILGKGCGSGAGMNVSVTPTATEQNPSAYVLEAWKQRSNNASVKAMIQGACSRDEERFTTWVDGYSMNPIQPTDDELNNSGGLQRYYERGGFLISRTLTNGIVPIDTTGQRGLHWNVGYYMCPNPAFWSSPRASKVYGGNKGAIAEDYAGGVPTPALYRHTAEGVGWNVYVMIDPSGQYAMRVTPADPGVGQKVLQGMAAIMEKFRELICAIVPLTQPIMQQQLLAELCVDANDKTCAKGTPGCKCTPPTTSQKDAVAATYALVGGICAMGHDAPSTPPPPQQISPPPDALAEKKIPWWAIVAGGIGVGLLAGFTAPPRR